MNLTYYTSVRVDEANAPARHVLGSCNGFSSLGHDVTLVFPRSASPAQNFQTTANYDVPLFYPSKRGGWRWFELLTAGHIRWRKNRSTADVLYFRYTPSDWVQRALHARDELKVLEVNGSEAFASKRFGNFLRPFDLVLFESEDLRDQFRALFPQHAAKAFVHETPGVSRDLFFPRQIRESRQKLRLSLERKVLLHASGYQPHHDFETIERAYRLAIQYRSDLLLILLGDGPRWLEIRQRMNDLIEQGYVLMPGTVTPEVLSKFIGAADVCLSLSIARVLAEGNLRAFKLYEYVSGGRPVIEAVDQNRQIPNWARNGLWLVPPESPASVVTAIDAVLTDQDLAAARVTAASRYVEKYRTWEAVSRSTVAIMSDALVEKRKAFG